MSNPLPARSEVYTPSPRAYEGSLPQALQQERLRIEDAFVQLEALIGAGEENPGSTPFFSSTYPNQDLEDLGLTPVLDLVESTCDVIVPTVGWDAVGRMGFGLCEWNGTLYLSGGVNAAGALINDLWSSPDGVSWAQVTGPGATPWAPRYAHRMVGFGDGVYVLNGDTAAPGLAPVAATDVWKWTPAGGWAQIMVNTPWTARMFFGALVFDTGSGDHVYVIGGLDGLGNRLNDVWETDFVASAQVGSLPEAIYTHSATVHSSRMYVFGGYYHTGTAVGLCAAMLSSADGISWRLESPFPRYVVGSIGGGMASHGGRLIVMPAQGLTLQSEIWSSEDLEVWVLAEQMSRGSTDYLIVPEMGEIMSFGGNLWIFGTAFRNNLQQIGLQAIRQISLVEGPVRIPIGYHAYYMYSSP